MLSVIMLSVVMLNVAAPLKITKPLPCRHHFHHLLAVEKAVVAVAALAVVEPLADVEVGDVPVGLAVVGEVDFVNNSWDNVISLFTAVIYECLY